MRKLVPLLVVVVVVGMAAPAAARKVVNESYSQLEIQVFLGDGESSGGQAWAWSGDQGSGMGIEYNAGFDCTDQPDDAIANYSIWAWVDPADVTVAPTTGRDKFMEGSASGTIGDGNLHIDYCGMDGEDIWLGGEWFAISMDGSGSLVKARNSNSWHIPGDFNDHDSNRATWRMATGYVAIGALCGELTAWCGVDGQIGEVTWTHHSNEK
jgi:hypothetical protein